MKTITLGLLLGLTLVGPLPIYAQTTIDTMTTTKLVWDQGAADLAQANAIRIQSYVDGALIGTVETFSCVGAATPFTCTTTRNAGQIAGSVQNNQTHTVKLGASLPLNGGGFTAETLSAVCSFRFPAAPSAPANLRFQ